jgi:hypothetical protein
MNPPMTERERHSFRWASIYGIFFGFLLGLLLMGSILR